MFFSSIDSLEQKGICLVSYQSYSAIKYESDILFVKGTMQMDLKLINYVWGVGGRPTILISKNLL